MSSESLKGKVAIVTGGGTLFGAAVAKTLINDGAKVLIVEINAETALQPNPGRKTRVFCILGLKLMKLVPMVLVGGKNLPL